MPETKTKETKTTENQTIEINPPGKQKTINQIYDKTIKRILTLSPGAVTNLINGLFHTEYPPDSSITYNWTEHHDDDLNRTLADTILTINGEHAYHIEAQMYEDEEIEFRVFDYGYKHALTSRGGSDTLHFPDPQIIFLYNGENLPDKKVITLDFGQQGTFDYHVPVFKLIEHSPQELSKMQMIILIPFAILKLRKEIEKNHSIKSMNALKSLIFDVILELIKENQLTGKITAADSQRLRNMIQKLYQHLYAKYQEFEDGGLNAMMEDGLVLEADIFEAEVTKRVTAEVTAQVTAEVTAQVTAEVTAQVTAQVTTDVTAQNQLATIRQLYSKLKNKHQVADLLDLPLETVQDAITE